MDTFDSKSVSFRGRCRIDFILFAPRRCELCLQVVFSVPSSPAFHFAGHCRVTLYLALVIGLTYFTSSWSNLIFQPVNQTLRRIRFVDPWFDQHQWSLVKVIPIKRFRLRSPLWFFAPRDQLPSFQPEQRNDHSVMRENQIRSFQK